MLLVVASMGENTAELAGSQRRAMVRLARTMAVSAEKAARKSDGLAYVFHLRATRFVGGPERQILGQARELRAHGFRTVVGSFLQGQEGAAFLAEASKQGLETLPALCRGPLDLSPAGCIAAKVRDRGIGLICAHDPKASLLGYLAARRAQVPFIVWSRGWTGETWRVRLYEAVHRRIMRRADLVIAVSQALANRCERVGVKRERLRIIPNAVETDGLVGAGVADLRAELGLPAGCPLVLSVGRLSAEKGHRHLVEAARRVVQELRDAHFVVLGDGRERRRLGEQARRLGLNGRFLFPGFRDDARQVMAQADVLALPSLTEGLPNVLLEAFAAGVPVVATAVGGVPELVRDGENGWLVPRGDSAGLASALIAALSDPGESARRGRSGQELVWAHYTFAAQAARAAEAFREVLSRRCGTRWKQHAQA
jgi:glycosyltransferase involved in cell wall biosynthesis